MRSIIEFALFAWVGISVVAVLIQLIRIARYKRANRATPSTEAQESSLEAPTIDLAKRLTTTQAADIDAPPTEALASAPSSEQTASSTAASNTTTSNTTTSNTATQAAPSVSTPVPPARPTPPAAPTSPAHDPVAAEATPTEAPPAAPPAPTLADLLAGVRLPWNLLPTVDQSREPSNDRVVLITSEGEPADIGVDVADELERLGFSIAPHGDDTAIATRGGHSLGLQIIEDPMTAEIDGTRRFPTATEASVALDIWIES